MVATLAGEAQCLALWGKSAGLERPYPLLAHLVDTAAAAYSLLCEHLPTSSVRALGIDRSDEGSIRRFAVIAGLHDLGKATPEFQRKDASQVDALAECGLRMRPGAPIGHDRSTQLTLIEAVGHQGGGIGGPTVGMLGVSSMLGGHHGTFHPLDAAEMNASHRHRLASSHPALGDAAWAGARSGLVASLLDAVDSPPLDNLPEGPALVVGAGLVVISDWIASQRSIVGHPSEWPEWDAVDWAKRFEERVAECGRAIRAAGISRPLFRSAGFEESFSFQPRPLQSSVASHLERSPGAGGLLLVTAPMGVGKTEAALHAARQLGGADSGLVFLLPTMATADAMFERVLPFAETVSAERSVVVGLVHSMASFNEAYTALPDHSVDPISDNAETMAIASGWLRGRQRTLLAPVSVATIDQLLAATLRSRHNFLRWLGLSGKTVIIDEAHSFDAYMHGLLETALQWLGRLGVPVVVMSATIPSRISRSLAGAWCAGAGISPPGKACPYPGWMHVSPSGDVAAAGVESPTVRYTVNRVDVTDWADSWHRAVADRLAPICDGGTGLVVCNTVADAQRLAAFLEPWAAEHEVELRCLHSRFPQWQRRSITSGIVESFGKSSAGRPKRSVLVATQIVEQSLDVDFDLLVTCLAPIAQLLQRSGRCHRHERQRPIRLSEPTIDVLVPVGGDGGLELPSPWTRVYPSAYLERTVTACLPATVHGVWELPDDVQRMVDTVYGDLADLADADPSDPLARQVDSEWLQRNLHFENRIPVPANLSQLSQLTSGADESLMLATRLGLDSTLVVCAWDSPGGPALDADGNTPLPQALAPDDVRTLIGATVPLRSSRATDEMAPLGNPWSESPWLSDARILAFDPRTLTAVTDNWQYRLDPLVGLVQERR